MPSTSPDELNNAFLVTARGRKGLTREAARTARFVAPSRGVRYPRASPDDASNGFNDRSSAAVLGAGPGAILVEVAAARTWTLPLPPWIGLGDTDAPIAVAATSGRNRPRRGDVRGRRLAIPAEHMTTLRGVPITTPARTWLDCAELVPVPHLIAMGDFLLSRQLCTPAELARMVAWGRGRRGVIGARRSLPHLDPRAESPSESLVRAHLVLGGIPKPVCNMNIISNGEWLARADLAWPLARLFVEYDAVVHLSEAQRRHDAARRNLLQAAGWLVITLTAAPRTARRGGPRGRKSPHAWPLARTR
ncbi:MAG: hypothetical protein NTX29_13135 [Actinobacteria bacterium]|nr:hypothetical protein [Actinomycetota bacterium]